MGVIYIVTADLLQPRYNILRYGRLTSRHLRLFTRHGGRLGRRLRDKWRKDTCNRICSSYTRKNCERSDVTRLHLLLLLLLLLVVVVVVVVPGYQDVVIVMLLFPGQGNRNRNGQEMKKDMETETETDKK